MTSWNCFDVVRQDDKLVIAEAQHAVLLDTQDIDRFGIELLGIVSEYEPTTLLVDLTPLARSSTAVINNLLVAKKKLLGYGGDLFLCGLHDALLHNFRILKLEGTVFQIYESKQAAIAGLEGTRTS